MITVRLEDIEEAERKVERDRIVAYLHWMGDHGSGLKSSARQALHDLAEDIRLKQHWMPVITQKLVQEEIANLSDEAIAEIGRQWDAGARIAGAYKKEPTNADLWRK